MCSLTDNIPCMTGGPYRPRSVNLLTGCVDCDWHGPDLPPMLLAWTPGEARDFHRTWHDAGRALTHDSKAVPLMMSALERLNDWLTKRQETAR